MKNYFIKNVIHGTIKQNEMMQLCMENENRYLENHGGILYDHLEEVLSTLSKKYFLSIVSNCQSGYIEAFLSYHKLGRYIDDIECFGNTKQNKSENIALVVERNALTEAVYVGDTQGDYDAARKAGVPFIHVGYGFGQVPSGTPVIMSLKELPEMASLQMK